MKTAVSLPDELFQQAEDLAGRLGVNRSQLYAIALGKLIASMPDDPVTSALDAWADAEAAHRWLATPEQGEEDALEAWTGHASQLSW